MKIPHKLFDRIVEPIFFNSSFLIGFFLICGSIIFLEPLNDLIKNMLVDHLVSKATSDLRNSIITSFILIGIVIFYIWAFINHYYGKTLLTFIIFSIALYHIYYRFYNTNVWDYYFVNSNKDSKIAYLDFIIVLSILHLFLLIGNFFWKIKNRRKSLNNQSLFSIDKIYSPKDKTDLLHRGNAAKKIADEIILFNSKESLAIGIIGKWGSGKSYFLDMVMSEIDEEENNILSIRFNPWRGKQSSGILNHFFSTLKSSLSMYNGEIESQIDSYVQQLALADQTGILESFKSNFSDTTSVDHEFGVINKTLKHINKKLVISIDDLDRLDKDEICQVLKIVRNNANFFNTIFISAYDKDYIINAIKKINKFNPESYLEKIFQIEFYLPLIRNEVIVNNFRSTLTEKLEKTETNISVFLQQFFFNKDIAAQLDQIIDIEQDYVSSKGFTNEDIFIYNISTLRDVTRLCNSFAFRYSFVQGYVNFEDYLLLEILKLKYNAIYNELKAKSFLITKRHPEVKSRIYTIDSTLLEAYLTKHNYTLNEKSTVVDLLHKIFKSSEPFDKRAIIAVESYDIYFADYLHGKITVIEFSRARSGSFDDLKNKVDTWILESKTDDLVDFLNNIYERDYINKSDYEKIIKIIFHLIHENITINWKQIINRLSDSNNRLVLRNFYENDEIALKSFLVSQIETLPIEMQQSLIGQLIRGHIYKDQPSVIPLKDLQDLSLSNLKKSILEITKNRKTATKDDVGYIFSLYYSCIETIDEQSTTVHLLKSASIEIREFVKKFSYSYLDFLIRPLYTPSDNKTFTLEPFIQSVFGTFDYFEKFLEDQPTTLVAIEVSQFFQKFKNNFYRPIQFTKNKIEFNSSSRVKFLGSPDYPNIGGGVGSHEFVHPAYNQFETRFPELNDCKWIAHTFPISTREASIGGDYNFQYSRILIFENKEIDIATITFLVDDYLTLKINGNTIFTKQDTFNQITKTFSIKTNLKGGQNLFEFTINNIPMDRSDISGMINPYGVVFKIELIYK